MSFFDLPKLLFVVCVHGITTHVTSRSPYPKSTYDVGDEIRGMHTAAHGKKDMWWKIKEATVRLILIGFCDLVEIQTQGGDKHVAPTCTLLWQRPCRSKASPLPASFLNEKKTNTPPELPDYFAHVSRFTSCCRKAEVQLAVNSSLRSLASPLSCPA